MSSPAATMLLTGAGSWIGRAVAPAAVLARSTGRPARDEPAPATFEDGLRAAELCEELYRRLR